MLNVKIKKLNPKAIIPEYKTINSSGVDLRALLDEPFIMLLPNEIKLIPTGLAMNIPIGYEGQVRPRSGLSLKTKLRVANSPGTIDSDYRGQICIIAENISDTNIKIENEDRIAQLVFTPVIQALFEIVDELDDTDRGDGGFGSTGVK